MTNTAPETLPSEEWQTAIARSVTYLFLSRGLAYPASEQLAFLRERVVPVLLGLDLGPASVAAVQQTLPGLRASLEDLQAAHVQVFSLTVSADCPDFETAYLPNDVFRQAEVMADAAGFYRAFGLEVGGQQFQRPDYLTTELEFMGFLARKEAHALEYFGADELAVVREAQQLFMRDHLGCWGAEVGRRIEAQGARNELVYGALGRLLGAWVAEELERLGVAPAWRAEGPRIEWPEQDDGSCGTDIGHSLMRTEKTA
ncbi:MAG: molecular chaperone [Vicinamibacterales bacterium]